jgi:hypothetical protein
MRCKVGDLAVYVGTFPQHLGRIVRVVSPRPWTEPAWWVDPPLPTPEAGLDGLSVYDSGLRPIRDSDGEDEMLRIAGKPETIREALKAIREAL